MSQDFIAFEKIYQTALKRAGNEHALTARFPEVKSAAELKAVPDDRYLATMTRRVFAAGLRMSVVEAKWPAFEEVFLGFEPHRVRAIDDEALEALMADSRIIRHWGKIKSVRHNAAAVCDIAAAQGSFGAYLADWPSAHVVELWADLAKRCAQLGGNSGPYFLRWVGKDSFVPTPYVVRALAHWGVLAEAKPPTAKRARAAVQDAFNRWAEETGRPLSHLSMILAQSVD